MSFITKWRRSAKTKDIKKDDVQDQDIPDGPDSPSRLSVINTPELDPIITDFRLQLPDNKDDLQSTNASNGTASHRMGHPMISCAASIASISGLFVAAVLFLCSERYAPPSVSVPLTYSCAHIERLCFFCPHV
ncbi:hypothetical protein NQZ68_017145 [Dissostichus eleginoides]|nr:hypothetical protein NQZ68_017145 [Dissostichus eleginoides]